MPSESRRLTLLATAALLAVTACWGSTFFLIHDLLERVPTLDFLAIRFAIASVTLVLLAPKALGRLTRDTRRQAVVLGCLYGVAQILQTAGLATTPASISGFITGMYVVATPVFAALLLRSRIGMMTWVAVALAMAGLGVLTLSGFSVGYGEALIFVAAMIYALHIVGLGAWSQPGQALGMATVQLIVITVICLVCTAPNGLVLPDRTSDWVSILYMAVFAGAGAMIGQTWAQAHLPPTRAAIIMAMEPVFAALFAVVLGGESASVRMIFGGLLVLAAMLIAELAPRRKVEAEVTHLTV
ncbi:DMT family transporter [Nocardioides sp.]|uniref:DMT family transporter n=1 Tax=Nocardioides sp. TaxID=35761 RepID=UPI002F3FE71C